MSERKTSDIPSAELERLLEAERASRRKLKGISSQESLLDLGYWAAEHGYDLLADRAADRATIAKLEDALPACATPRPKVSAV